MAAYEARKTSWLAMSTVLTAYSVTHGTKRDVARFVRWRAMFTANTFFAILEAR